jgi:hypothetical protein
MQPFTSQEEFHLELGYKNFKGDFAKVRANMLFQQSRSIAELETHWENLSTDRDTRSTPSTVPSVAFRRHEAKMLLEEFKLPSKTTSTGPNPLPTEQHLLTQKPERRSIEKRILVKTTDLPSSKKKRAEEFTSKRYSLDSESHELASEDGISDYDGSVALTPTSIKQPSSIKLTKSAERSARLSVSERDAERIVLELSDALNQHSAIRFKSSVTEGSSDEELESMITNSKMAHSRRWRIHSLERALALTSYCRDDLREIMLAKIVEIALRSSHPSDYSELFWTTSGSFTKHSRSAKKVNTDDSLMLNLFLRLELASTTQELEPLLPMLACILAVALQDQDSPVRHRAACLRTRWLKDAEAEDSAARSLLCLLQPLRPK